MFDGVSSGEPNIFKIVVKMMQMDASSSMIHQWMMMFMIETRI
jgi:hypothetical protein